MLNKTTDYDKFKFRPDNREKISQSHVDYLARSITKRNLLEARPIQVNATMEVLDGQHRLLAAKKLGLPIYYEYQHELSSKDILILSKNKAWGAQDYLNYYVRNGYEEYIKLHAFVEKHNLNIKSALSLFMGIDKPSMEAFKEGELKCDVLNLEPYVEQCWETIRLVQKVTKHSYHLYSARFWQALIQLIKQPGFDYQIWMRKVGILADKMGPRARKEDYLKAFKEIYNWKNRERLDFLD